MRHNRLALLLVHRRPSAFGWRAHESIASRPRLPRVGFRAVHGSYNFGKRNVPATVRDGSGEQGDNLRTVTVCVELSAHLEQPNVNSSTAARAGREQVEKPARQF